MVAIADSCCMKANNQADDLSGLWVPIITPFDSDDRVDLVAIKRLCRRILGDGAHGIVALGTTGEPSVLTDDEQREVVLTAAEACADLGRPLMVGTGTNSTRVTIENVGALRNVAGVVATLVVVPYYTRPSCAAIVEHFRVVASESPVPVVVYNIPYRTGRGLNASDLLRIAEFENVAGLKQSVAGLDGDTLEVLRSAPPSFLVFSGDDAFIAPTILMGGAGAIAAAAHVCTPMFAAMVTSALLGDAAEARRLANALLPVVAAGMAEPNPAVWKAALHHVGEIPTQNLRAPMSCATTEAKTQLLAAIAAASRSGSNQPVPVA